VSWNFYRVAKWEDKWSGDARRVPRREGRGSHGSHTVLRSFDGLVDGIRLASALDGRRWRELDRLPVCLQGYPIGRDTLSCRIWSFGNERFFLPRLHHSFHRSSSIVACLSGRPTMPSSIVLISEYISAHRTIPNKP
jgi:hypothetical protein